MKESMNSLKEMVAKKSFFKWALEKDHLEKAKFGPFRGSLDIHKAIGRLPKPKSGWTLPGHKYTGPYNPLHKQLT